MRWLSLSCVLGLALSGCAAHYSSRTETSAGSAQVSVSSGTPLGNAVLIGIMAAEAVNYRSGPSAPVPDLARRVNVQDCTRPFDPTLGNLYCR